MNRKNKIETKRVSYNLNIETIKALHNFVHIDYTLRSNTSIIVEDAITEYLAKTNAQTITNTLCAQTMKKLVCYSLSIALLKDLHDFVHTTRAAMPIAATNTANLNMSMIVETAITEYLNTHKS